MRTHGVIIGRVVFIPRPRLLLRFNRSSRFIPPIFISTWFELLIKYIRGIVIYLQLLDEVRETLPQVFQLVLEQLVRTLLHPQLPPSMFHLVKLETPLGTTEEHPLLSILILSLVMRAIFRPNILYQHLGYTQSHIRWHLYVLCIQVVEYLLIRLYQLHGVRS